MSQINIDICIATYKRTNWLSCLLESLLRQKLPGHFSLRIIVIDNDADRSAEDVVKVFFSGRDASYVYDVQAEKNIALTRNKALEYVTGDYLVFIDDDEWASESWLSQLVNASKNYNADVVFGPVIPVFQENAPSWIIRGKFFERNNVSGTFLTHGPTNNTLVRNPKSFGNKLVFSKEYGVTGGSDTELFSRLHKAGAKLVWCDEAKVYEHVPENRATLRWLVMRALRGGQVYARIFHKDQTLLNSIVFVLKRFSYLLVTIILLPVSLFGGKVLTVWVLRKIFANFGQLSVLFVTKTYQEYK